MLLKSPKTKSTRLQLPLGVASTSGAEPASAEVGTLSFDPDRDKVRVQTSTGWQDVGPGGGGGATTPWTAPPASPTYAEEFTSDPFLAAGWSLLNKTASVSITTRAGDVDWYSNTLSSSQYNSSVIGDRLFVQIPLSSDVIFYRTLSAANSLVTARVSDQSTAAGGFWALFVAADLAGAPDLSNATFVGWEPGTYLQRYQTIGGASTVDGNSGQAYSDFHAVSERFSGSSRDSTQYNIFDGKNFEYPTRTFTPTIVYTGLRFIATTVVTSSVFCLDWLRVMPNTASLVSN